MKIESNGCTTNTQTSENIENLVFYLGSAGNSTRELRDVDSMVTGMQPLDQGGRKTTRLIKLYT